MPYPSREQDYEDWYQQLMDDVQYGSGAPRLPIPYRAIPGPQFDPKDVPIIPSESGQLYYQPMFNAGDRRTLASGEQIRSRIGAVPQSAMQASNTKGGTMNGYNWTPEQQAIIDRIKSGQTDYTFGPGSPNPTHEDMHTYVGGKFSPAGGFAVNGGVALAPREYDMFTPEQRRYLGIMDIAPKDQAGKIERYYGSDYAGGSPSRGAFVQPPVSGGAYASAAPLYGSGSNPAGMSTWQDYGAAQQRGQAIAGIGQALGSILGNLGKSQQQNQMNPLALLKKPTTNLAAYAPVPYPNLSQFFT